MYRHLLISLSLIVGGCALLQPTKTSITLASDVAVDGDSANLPNGEPTGATVLLRRVTLPSYLDRTAVIVDQHGNVVQIDQRAQWAEQLGAGVKRVFAEALAQRIGPARLIIQGDGRPIDADLSIQFDTLVPRDGAVELDARWSLVCAAPIDSRAGRHRFSVPLAAPRAAEVAAATSRALTRFAALLADQLRCPSAPNSPMRS